MSTYAFSKEVFRHDSKWTYLYSGCDECIILAWSVTGKAEKVKGSCRNMRRFCLPRCGRHGIFWENRFACTCEPELQIARFRIHACSLIFLASCIWPPQSVLIHVIFWELWQEPQFKAELFKICSKLRSRKRNSLGRKQEFTVCLGRFRYLEHYWQYSGFANSEKKDFRNWEFLNLLEKAITYA